MKMDNIATEIDTFQLEIIKNSFDTIADDMALTLMRTAYSSIVRDSLDFSTAICSPNGLTLAQGVCTPLLVGSFYDAMQALLNKYKNKIRSKDIFIFNDPFVAGGQHLPDIFIAKPIFYKELYCGWAVTVAHHSDVGGIVAGSNAIGGEEIFQEGLRIPIIKIEEQGVPNRAVWDLIALNVRTPDEVHGDLQAQIASCNSGESGMLQLFERYGVNNVLTYGDQLQDYAERITRAEIKDFPDGTYKFTDHIDGVGEDPDPLVLQTTVIISGDSISVDWTGTADQVSAGINPSFSYTKSATYAALRSVMESEIPNCYGFTLPITVSAPLGSLVNPRFPAPCGARGITGFRMIDCLFGALATALPDRVTADTSGGATLPTISGYQNGKPFVFCETFMGTWGATSKHDGQSGVPHMGANQSNVSIEMLETKYPIRINEYSMIPNTGGPGQFRGGLGLVREYEILSDHANLNVRSDKRKFPPHGLFGGKPGSPSWNVVNPKKNCRRLPVLMTEIEKLIKGDVYRHEMSGGGGFGDPMKRDPDLVLQDVLEEKIDKEHAKIEYGVFIVTESNGLLQVDMESTALLRLKRSGVAKSLGLD